MYFNTGSVCFDLNPQALQSTAYLLAVIRAKESPEIELRLFSDYAIRGWSGIEEAFSADLAFSILQDLPDLVTELKQACFQWLNGRAIRLKEWADCLKDVLAYELEQGPLEETLLRRARAERKPTPKAIAEAPLLAPGLGFYFQAFLALSSCRPVGMSEGRIPWTAAAEYARHMEMSSEEFEDLWALVSSMDGAYLTWQNNKQEQRRKTEAMKGR